MRSSSSLGPLRIAEIAPVASAVGPDATGSIESLVWSLCERLQERGSRVTLFATADSVTRATLRAHYALGYDREDGPWDWRLTEGLHAAAAFAAADDFDIVHCHTIYGLPFALRCRAPTVVTHHTEIGPEVVEAHLRLPTAEVVCASRAHAGRLNDLPRVHVINHGIDFDAFGLGDGGGELLYLGRLIADKGPVQAIEIARAAGRPIVLAGSAEDDDDDYDDAIAPMVDGVMVRYLGAVDAAERTQLLARAGALVYPLQYPEPFGLVLAEAMACGTPVLAHPVGAVPEIVTEGENGFTSLTVEGLAALVPAALALDRARIRAGARERFDLERMVTRYETLFRRCARAEV